MILGAHVSAQGGVENSPINAAKLGIHAIQIFSKNQRQWSAKPLTEDSIKGWFEGLKEHKITHAVSHVSYLINLCNPEEEKRRKSIDAMIDELERADQLGIPNAIVHPGSHLKEGEEWGLSEIARSIDIIHSEKPDLKSHITLELTAGQGTNLGYRFEHLAAIIAAVDEKDRVDICYDTCHGFSGGYDIRTKETYEKVWSDFDTIIGLDKLKVFHLNDSKKEFESRKDRHEKIGHGTIGAEAFDMLIHDDRFKSIPALLETPEDEDLGGGFAVDLKTLQELM